MLPVLTEIHAFGRLFALHSFGLTVAIGFAVGLLVTLRMGARARRLIALGRDQAGLDPAGPQAELEHIIELSLWGLVGGIFGARVAYVLFSDPSAWGDCFRPIASGRGLSVLGDCLAPLRFWQSGGLVYYGAVVSALGAAVLYVRRHRLRLGATLDLFAPGLAIGHAFGRIGCFLAGCCFGKPLGSAAAPWGVSFPKTSVAFQELSDIALTRGEHTVPLHPTQLYEAFGEALIFALLVRLFPRRRFGGQIFAVYLAAYALLRFLVEFARGDVRRGVVSAGILAGLSFAQILSLIGLLVGLGGLLIGWLRARRRASVLG